MGSLSEGVRVAAAQDRTIADGEQRAATLVRQAVGGASPAHSPSSVPAPETASSSTPPASSLLRARLPRSPRPHDRQHAQGRAARSHNGGPPLSAATPLPAPSAGPHRRVRSPSWINGRLLLGLLLALVGILGGALWLQGAQRLVPVYAAARDPLRSGACGW